MNKFDEVQVLFQQHDIDIGVITESWFSAGVPDNLMSIQNYNLFSKCRDSQRGGGVAVYVREQIPASLVDNIIVPDQLECIWVKIRPTRLPRGISSIVLCAVYITTNSPHQEHLLEHILQNIDNLRTDNPEIGIVVLGDFNRMNVNSLVRGNDMFQIVDFCTRAEATLDLILTNSKLNSLYCKPKALAPIGSSDHVCIIWKPKCRIVDNAISTKTFRPMHDSCIRSFGTWIEKPRLEFSS